MWPLRCSTRRHLPSWCAALRKARQITKPRSIDILLACTYRLLHMLHMICNIVALSRIAWREWKEQRTKTILHTRARMPATWSSHRKWGFMMVVLVVFLAILHCTWRSASPFRYLVAPLSPHQNRAHSPSSHIYNISMCHAICIRPLQRSSRFVFVVHICAMRICGWSMLIASEIALARRINAFLLSPSLWPPLVLIAGRYMVVIVNLICHFNSLHYDFVLYFYHLHWPLLVYAGVIIMTMFTFMASVGWTLLRHHWRWLCDARMECARENWQVHDAHTRSGFYQFRHALPQKPESNHVDLFIAVCVLSGNWKRSWETALFALASEYII